MRHRETTTNPYASVGKQIMDECEANKVTYKFACATKHKPGSIWWMSANAHRIWMKLPKTDERGE